MGTNLILPISSFLSSDFKTSIEDFFSEFNDIWNDDWLKSNNHIKEENDKYILFYEAPGLKPEDIDIQYNEDLLRVELKWPKDYFMGEKKKHIKQIIKGVDPNKIEANLDKGVLKIILPKKKEVVAKKIKVTT